MLSIRLLDISQLSRSNLVSCIWVTLDEKHYDFPLYTKIFLELYIHFEYLTDVAKRTHSEYKFAEYTHVWRVAIDSIHIYLWTFSESQHPWPTPGWYVQSAPQWNLPRLALFRPRPTWTLFLRHFGNPLETMSEKNRRKHRRLPMQCFLIGIRFMRKQTYGS